jgi:hypothetical protein
VVLALAALAWLVGGAVLVAALTLRDSSSGPVADAPEPPRPLVAGEAYVDTQVLPTGDLLVRHWIRTRSPIGSLVLTRPDGADDLSAEDVEVVAGGSSADGPVRVGADPATYSFGAATDVLLTYRVLGAVEVSDSAAGRGLVLATTLETAYEPGATRETRVVRGPEVLSLACSPGSDRPPATSTATRRWPPDCSRRSTSAECDRAAQRQAGSSSRPCSMAQRVSWTRLFICSLRRVFWTWFCTVRCESTNRAAICL